MQVPVVMTNSLGQKISTVAVQSANPSLFTTAPTSTGSATGMNAPKVLIQTMPTMVPATAENGDRITVQLAKIITIPATQLTQCQLQAKPGSPTGINLMGVRALTPMPVAQGTQVVRLAVPAQQSPAQAKTQVPVSIQTQTRVPISVQTASTPAPVPVQIQIQQSQLSPKAKSTAQTSESKPDSTSAEQPEQDSPTQAAAEVLEEGSKPQFAAESWRVMRFVSHELYDKWIYNPQILFNRILGNQTGVVQFQVQVWFHFMYSKQAKTPTCISAPFLTSCELTLDVRHFNYD